MKARQSMDKSKPPQNNRGGNSRTASSSTTSSSSAAVKDKNDLRDDQERILDQLMTRDEKAILERRKAWERARAEENDS